MQAHQEIDKRRQPPALDEIPSLVSDLGDEVSQLVDAKVGLLKLEIKDELATYVFNSAMVAGSAALAGIGFVLGSLALVIGVASILLRNGFGAQASYGVSFIVVAVVYFVVGLIGALTFIKRLSHHDPTPERTVQELRKDKKWLKQEL